LGEYGIDLQYYTNVWWVVLSMLSAIRNIAVVNAALDSNSFGHFHIEGVAFLARIVALRMFIVLCIALKGIAGLQMKPTLYSFDSLLISLDESLWYYSCFCHVALVSCAFFMAQNPMKYAKATRRKYPYAIFVLVTAIVPLYLGVGMFCTNSLAYHGQAHPVPTGVWRTQVTIGGCALFVWCVYVVKYTSGKLRLSVLRAGNVRSSKAITFLVVLVVVFFAPLVLQYIFLPFACTQPGYWRSCLQVTADSVSFFAPLASWFVWRGYFCPPHPSDAVDDVESSYAALPSGEFMNPRE
jgi:hypothetical protein